MLSEDILLWFWLKRELENDKEIRWERWWDADGNHKWW